MSENKNPNELYLLDRKWLYERRHTRWICPRNGRSVDAAFVHGLETNRLQNIVFLMERGFVIAKKSGNWCRGPVVVTPGDLSRPMADLRDEVLEILYKASKSDEDSQSEGQKEEEEEKKKEKG